MLLHRFCSLSFSLTSAPNVCAVFKPSIWLNFFNPCVCTVMIEANFFKSFAGNCTDASFSSNSDRCKIHENFNKFLTSWTFNLIRLTPSFFFFLSTIFSRFFRCFFDRIRVTCFCSVFWIFVSRFFDGKTRAFDWSYPPYSVCSPSISNFICECHTKIRSVPSN